MLTVLLVATGVIFGSIFGLITARLTAMAKRCGPPDDVDDAEPLPPLSDSALADLEGGR